MNGVTTAEMTLVTAVFGDYDFATESHMGERLKYATGACSTAMASSLLLRHLFTPASSRHIPQSPRHTRTCR